MCYDITYQTNLTIHFAEKPRGFSLCQFVRYDEKRSHYGEREWIATLIRSLILLLKARRSWERFAFPPRPGQLLRMRYASIFRASKSCLRVSFTIRRLKPIAPSSCRTMCCIFPLADGMTRNGWRPPLCSLSYLVNSSWNSSCATGTAARLTCWINSRFRAAVPGSALFCCRR